MKIFISHQQMDTNLANNIYELLKSKGVEAYLDVMYNLHSTDSKYLTNHLKQIVNKSTDILVVMTDHTKNSWWVPFEIGMAANKDLRIVTYLQSELKLPEFLDYWPRLKKYEDIQKYINAHKYRIQEENLRNSISMDSYNFSNNQFTNDDFYRILKESLNN